MSEWKKAVFVFLVSFVGASAVVFGLELFIEIIILDRPIVLGGSLLTALGCGFIFGLYELFKLLVPP